MGQIYDECGDGCALSCDDLPGKGSCKRECVEGCRCPHGEYVNEEGECVPKQKCHCNFDGMSFRPGYKEVRPGQKFLDLCTCTDGVWDCQDAEPGDKDKYPPSSELRCAVRSSNRSRRSRRIATHVPARMVNGVARRINVAPAVGPLEIRIIRRSMASATISWASARTIC